MSSTRERAWLAAHQKGSKALVQRLDKAHANNPDYQAFKKKHGLGDTSSVKQVSKSTLDRAKEKARQTLAGKAYGATKGTRMGSAEGTGETLRDTITPLTRDQHSAVKAAEREAKAAEKPAAAPKKPAKPKKEKATKPEKKKPSALELIAAAAAKRKINQPPVSAKALRRIAAVGDMEHDHGGFEDLGDTQYGGRHSYNEETIVEGGNYGKPYDNDADLKSKSNKELQSLHDFWKTRIEKDPNHSRAKDQIAKIKAILASKIGKKTNEEVELDEAYDVNAHAEKIHKRVTNPRNLDRINTFAEIKKAYTAGRGKTGFPLFHSDVVRIPGYSLVDSNANGKHPNVSRIARGLLAAHNAGKKSVKEEIELSEMDSEGYRGTSEPHHSSYAGKKWVEAKPITPEQAVKGASKIFKDILKKQKQSKPVKEEAELDEVAKWRTNPKAHDVDTDGSYLTKTHDKTDPLKSRAEYLSTAKDYIRKNIKNVRNASKQSQGFAKSAIKMFPQKEEVEQIDEMKYGIGTVVKLKKPVDGHEYATVKGFTSSGSTSGPTGRGVPMPAGKVKKVKVALRKNDDHSYYAGPVTHIEHDDIHSVIRESAPGWMIRQNPELAKKVKARIAIAKNRKKQMGNPEPVKEAKKHHMGGALFADTAARLQKAVNAHKERMNQIENGPEDTYHHAGLNLTTKSRVKLPAPWAKVEDK